MSYFNRNNANAPRAPAPSSLGPGGTYTSLPSSTSLPPRSGQASPAPAPAQREPPVRRAPPADPFASGRAAPPPQQAYGGQGYGAGGGASALPSREREKYGQLAGAAGYGGGGGGGEKDGYGNDQGRGGQAAYQGHQQGQGQGYGQSPRRAGTGGGGQWPRLWVESISTRLIPRADTTHPVRPTRFNVAPCPNDALALTSKLVVCPSDDYGGEYVRIKGGFVLATM